VVVGYESYVICKRGDIGILTYTRWCGVILFYFLALVYKT
jgi:hypothetical protein